MKNNKRKYIFVTSLLFLTGVLSVGLSVKDNNFKVSQSLEAKVTNDNLKLSSTTSTVLTEAISKEIGFFNQQNIILSDWYFAPRVVTIDRGFQYSTGLKSIYIPKEITSISSAFFHSKLQKIEFEPGTNLQIIGDHSFYNAPLPEITIPKSVRKIGRSAFAKSSLLNLTFEPGSYVNTIENDAFAETKLKTIVIPTSVKVMGTNVFKSTFNLKVTMPIWFKKHGPEYFGLSAVQWNDVSWTHDTTIISSLTSEMLLYAGWDKKSTITLDDWKTTFPKVVEINGAWYDNTQIKHIEIPSQIKLLDESAFTNTYSLEKVIFEPNSQLTSIPQVSFMRSGTLLDIEIPKSIKSIGSQAFKFSGIRNLTFEKGSQLESIGVQAFTNSKSLKKIAINTSIKNIGTDAFAETGLTDITFPEKFQTLAPSFGFTQVQLDSINWIYDMTREQVLTKALAEKILFLDKDIITLEDWKKYAPNVIAISAGTWQNNQVTNSIIIPAKIKSLGDSSFELSTIKKIDFEENSQLQTIGSRTFKQTMIESIVIPPVISIGAQAFASTALTHISIFSHLKIHLDTYGFSDEQIKIIDWVHESTTESTHLTSSVVELIGWDVKTSISLNDWKRQAPNVTNITFAFNNNKFLTNIEIPSNILDIGSGSFQNSVLETITFEENSELKSIGKNSFDSSALKSIDIPTSVDSIGQDAFANNNSLTIISLSERFKDGGERYGLTNNQWEMVNWGVDTTKKSSKSPMILLILSLVLLFTFSATSTIFLRMAIKNNSKKNNLLD